MTVNNLLAFDSETIRRDAAWFAAGARIHCMYSIVGTLAIGAIVMLCAKVFDLGVASAVSTLTIACFLLNSIIGGYLDFTSREFAKTKSIPVDNF